MDETADSIDAYFDISDGKDGEDARRTLEGTYKTSGARVRMIRDGIADGRISPEEGERLLRREASLTRDAGIHIVENQEGILPIADATRTSMHIVATNVATGAYFGARYTMRYAYVWGVRVFFVGRTAAAGASSVAQAGKLARQLVSEEQAAAAVAGEGEAIMGVGTDTPLFQRTVDGLIERFGGTADDWVKMRGVSSCERGVRTPAGDFFEVHWYQSTRTGQVVEIKTKIAGH